MARCIQISKNDAEKSLTKLVIWRQLKQLICHQQGVSSEAFNKWFVTHKKSIVPVEVVGMPDDSTCKVCHSKEALSVTAPILEYLKLFGFISFGREAGSFMLTVSGLKNFYFLSHFHDMRCGYSRIMEVIRMSYHRNPYQGDVFFFMSKGKHSIAFLFAFSR